MRPPTSADREDFIGSADDYEWLAGWFDLDANVVGVWKGPGTVLIVLSKELDDGSPGPLTQEEVSMFREVLEEWTIIGAVITVVSVG